MDFHGFSIVNHPFGGTIILGNPHMDWCYKPICFLFACKLGYIRAILYWTINPNWGWQSICEKRQIVCISSGITFWAFNGIPFSSIFQEPQSITYIVMWWFMNPRLTLSNFSKVTRLGHKGYIKPCQERLECQNKCEFKSAEWCSLTPFLLGDVGGNC